MTAFALTQEQQDFAERVRNLASGQLRALAEAGTPGQVNRELIKAMGESGLLSRLFPGVGAGGLSREAAAMDLCILREALFRPSVGAFAVGMAQAATDAAVAHAGTRTAFGGPLKDQQAVSHLLAEMATRTEAARLLVYAAAAAYDAAARADAGPGGAGGPAGAGGAGGKGLAAKSAMANLFATETAQFVVDAAVQIHGARALRRGHLLEHLYREVRAPRIYEGASEVQRTIIARELYR